MRGRPGPGNPPTKTHYYFVFLEGGDKSVLKLRLRNLSWHWLANGWLVFTGSDTCDKEQAGGSRRGGRTEQDIVATQLILSCRPPSSMLLPSAEQDVPVNFEGKPFGKNKKRIAHQFVGCRLGGSDI